jgi:urease accessory protein
LSAGEVTDVAAVLAMLQLADSFFPTGGYAHSLGLEGMVRQGQVRDEAELGEYLAGQLEWAVVPSDGVALLNAHRFARVAGSDDLDLIVAIDRRLFAMKLSRELRQASTRVGRRLLTETSGFGLTGRQRAYAALVMAGDSPGCSAVAFGLTAAGLGIPPTFALPAFCHGYLVGVLGAALRLLPLSHTQVQRILRGLQPLVERLAVDVADRSWTEMMAFAPELDLAAIGHERDDPRFFAS